MDSIRIRTGSGWLVANESSDVENAICVQLISDEGEVKSEVTCDVNNDIIKYAEKKEEYIEEVRVSQIDEIKGKLTDNLDKAIGKFRYMVKTLKSISKVFGITTMSSLATLIHIDYYSSVEPYIENLNTSGYSDTFRERDIDTLKAEIDRCKSTYDLSYLMGKYNKIINSVNYMYSIFDDKLKKMIDEKVAEEDKRRKEIISRLG